MVMKEVGLAEAKATLSALLDRGLRPWGLAKGEFVVPDDFNDPLPDDLLDLFEGKGDKDLLS